jgi:hypothetical protein
MLSFLCYSFPTSDDSRQQGAKGAHALSNSPPSLVNGSVGARLAAMNVLSG